MNIGIIGSGTMGIGIAQVAATSGCEVFLYDTNLAQTEKSLLSLKVTLDKLVAKQKISAETSEKIFKSIIPCAELSDLKDCDLIIEAIIENKEIKTGVFKKLEEIVSEKCIISSNTSSISITSLSSELKKPERFIGIHFFNPAPLMPLVSPIARASFRFCPEQKAFPRPEIATQRTAVSLLQSLMKLRSSVSKVLFKLLKVSGWLR